MDAQWFYDQCVDKWGFNDGGAVPQGADVYRDILINVINSALPESCPVEAYAFDCMGAHNYLYICYRLKGEEEGDLPEPDEVPDIISSFDESEILWNFVNVQVTTSPTLEDAIKDWLNDFKAQEAVEQDKS